MTNRRPGPAVVIWSSLALFGVLFALLVFQLSASAGSAATASRPTLVRKVIKRKVITTVVPTPGRSTVSAGPSTSSEAGAEAAPLTTGAS